METYGDTTQRLPPIEDYAPLADGETTALVPPAARLDETISIYRDVSGYPHVPDDDVCRNPDQLFPEELHATAWPVIARRLQGDRERGMARFAELYGTGRASTDPAKVAEAGTQGRVDTLMLTASPSCCELASPGSPRVLQLGADDAFTHCELLDRIAADTLTTSGQICACRSPRCPAIQMSPHYSVADASAATRWSESMSTVIALLSGPCRCRRGLPVRPASGRDHAPPSVRRTGQSERAGPRRRRRRSVVRHAEPVCF